MFAVNNNPNEPETIVLPNNDSVRKQSVLVELNSKLLLVRQKIEAAKIEEAVIAERKKNYREFEKMLEDLRLKLSGK